MEMISLTGKEPNDESCIVLGDVGYDIGHRIRRWTHQDGFDGYTKKKVVVESVNRKTGKTKKKVIKGPRYSRRSFRKPVDNITQLFVHHSGGDGKDPTGMYNTLYMHRKLSVHFACEDDGRIWQFNDMIDCCWHAGEFNKLSVGVELCLYPLADERPRYYDDDRRRRTGNLPHDVRKEIIHGRQIKVFVMPENQWQGLAVVYAGAWCAIGHQRSKGFTGPFDAPPKFPRDRNGQVSRTVVPDGKKHVGLFCHFQATRRKIDPCGFAFDEFEAAVEEYYRRFRGNLK